MAKGDSLDQNFNPQEAETQPDLGREAVVEQWGGEEAAQGVKRLMEQFRALHEQDMALAESFKAEMRTALLGGEPDQRTLEDLAARIRQAAESTRPDPSATTFFEIRRPEDRSPALRREMPLKPVEAKPEDPWEITRKQMLEAGYINPQGNLLAEPPGWTREQVMYLTALQRQKFEQASARVASAAAAERPIVTSDRLRQDKQQMETRLAQFKARLAGLERTPGQEMNVDSLRESIRNLEADIRETSQKLTG